VVSGDNTDGKGLVRDLSENLGVALAGRRLLILGAGGAAAGVIGPLLAERPAELVIVNRTPQKALALARRFAAATQAGARVEAAQYEAVRGRQFDVVINATSAGLHDAMPALPAHVFAPAALAYDMVYGRETPFLKMAREAAVRGADGLGMLVEQAAESFLIWRGIRPATAPVIALLRKP
jgi:shikimate dehydrogenase